MIAREYEGSGRITAHPELISPQCATSSVTEKAIPSRPARQKRRRVYFAPPLDKAGNSVKAQLTIAHVAEKLGLNLFAPSSVGRK
jgi:hypothetical protein